MNAPLTLRNFLLVVLVGVLVALIPLGYAWTKVTAELENIEIKLKGIDTRVDQLQVCQIAEGRALANTDRIKEAHERVSELEKLLSQCGERLQEKHGSQSSGETGM